MDKIITEIEWEQDHIPALVIPTPPSLEILSAEAVLVNIVINENNIVNSNLDNGLYRAYYEAHRNTLIVQQLENYYHLLPPSILRSIVKTLLKNFFIKERFNFLELDRFYVEDMQLFSVHPNFREHFRTRLFY